MRRDLRVDHPGIPPAVDQHAGIQAVGSVSQESEAKPHEHVTGEHQRREVQQAEQGTLNQPRIAATENLFQGTLSQRPCRAPRGL